MKIFIRSLVTAVLLSVALFAAELPELPKEAVKLQKDYQKSSEAALAPIRERYIADMMKLYGIAMEKKDINQALAIKQEINEAIAQTMAGEWRESSGELLTIRGGGITSHSNGATGTWLIKGDEMKLKWSNGAQHTFPITVTRQTLRGTLNAEDSVVLTRTK
jgi:hypothetical protein